MGNCLKGNLEELDENILVNNEQSNASDARVERHFNIHLSSSTGPMVS